MKKRKRDIERERGKGKKRCVPDRNNIRNSF